MAILYKCGGKKGILGKGGKDFKSAGAYKKWLGYGHATGVFAKTPGHQKVSIKGKKKKVKHQKK